jgi:hypothetical protein
LLLLLLLLPLLCLSASSLLCPQRANQIDPSLPKWDWPQKGSTLFPPFPVQHLQAKIIPLNLILLRFAGLGIGNLAVECRRPKNLTDGLSATK